MLLLVPCRQFFFSLITDQRCGFVLFPLIQATSQGKSRQLQALLPFSVGSSQPYVLLHGAIASRPCMHLKQMHLWCGLVRIAPCARSLWRSEWVCVYVSMCSQALRVWGKLERCGCMSWHTRSDRRLTQIFVFVCLFWQHILLLQQFILKLLTSFT